MNNVPSKLLIAALSLSLWACGSTPSATQDTAKAGPICTTGEECLMEGMKWESGFGRVPKASRAAQFYQTACEQQEMLGCYNLGVMLQGGIGVERNEELAVSFYAKGCDGGDQNSCANRAFLQARNNPEPEQLKESAGVYQTACDAGVMVACFNLADMRQAGRGVERDMKLAHGLFKEACYGGQTSGCIRWAWLDAQGCTASNECSKPAADERAAALLVEATCNDNGPPHACVAYGLHMESGRLLKRDLQSARAQYERVSKTGEAWAAERLANMMIRGRGGARDPVQAEQLFAQSCEGKYAPACVQLASIYLASTVDSAAQSLGIEALKKGCVLHEGTACNTLRLLCYSGTKDACAPK